MLRRRTEKIIVLNISFVSWYTWFILESSSKIGPISRLLLSDSQLPTHRLCAKVSGPPPPQQSFLSLDLLIIAILRGMS